MANKNNWLVRGLLMLLFTSILAGIGADRTFLWGQVEKKVNKEQYQKDIDDVKKQMDDAVKRIEKAGDTYEERAKELRAVMDKLLFELRGVR